MYLELRTTPKVGVGGGGNGSTGREGRAGGGEVWKREGGREEGGKGEVLGQMVHCGR